MVALDDGGLIRAGLNHVRVDGALREEGHVGVAAGFLFKGAGELKADDLALLLGLGHAGDRGKEALGRVDGDEVQIHAGEYVGDLFGLVFAHEAVVDIDAQKLLSDGAGKERRADRRIHAAGQAEKHLLIADLLAHGAQLRFEVIFHIIVARRAAHVIEEAAENLLTVVGVFDLRVELHAVDMRLFVCERGDGAQRGLRVAAEILGHFDHAVGVAHQHLRVGYVKKEGEGGVELGVQRAVFALFAGCDAATQLVRQKLHAVADAQNRYAKAKNLVLAVRRAFFIYAVRPAGEDQADGRHFLYARRGGGAGQNDRIHAELAHAPGDELLILAAEIEDDNRLIHANAASQVCRMGGENSLNKE